jgi:hypothetical protein
MGVLHRHRTVAHADHPSRRVRIAPSPAWPTARIRSIELIELEPH